MTTQHTAANNKIIIFVAFICAAIMASLFVYRSTHQQKPVVLSGGNATLFTVPREIKDFKLMDTNQQTVTLKDFRGHWTMVFFGFTHCSTICPVTLEKLSKAYPALHAADPTLQIAFVSLDPERDKPKQLAQYINQFNPSFVALSGPIQEIRKFQSQFGIFAAKDKASDPNNYQIQHSSSIVLLDPKGRFAGLFNASMTVAELSQSFTQSLHQHEML